MSEPSTPVPSRDAKPSAYVPPQITMGRKVYWRSHEGKIYSADVALVHPDGESVNLVVANHDGSTFAARVAKMASDPLGSLASQTVDNTWFWPPRT
jgi:hypothetical protein